MKYYGFLIIMVSTLFVKGQTSNLVFFTEASENFLLSVNGKQINEKPLAKVTATGLTGDMVQVKVVFETAGAPVLTKSMLIDPGKETTAVIRKNKKGKYVFRQVSISDVVENQPTETVMITQAAPVEQQAIATSSTTDSPKVKNNDSSNGNSSFIDLKVTQEGGLSLKVNQGNLLGGSAVDETEANTQTSNTIPSHQSTLTARVDGNRIVLSDGRILTFKYVNSGRIGPMVEMKQPVGAQVSISYDGSEAFTSEVPFVYEENDWKKSKVYFKLSVSEVQGNRWSVKLKHNSSKMIIEGAQAKPANPSTLTAAPAASIGCSSPMSDADFTRAQQSISNKSFAEEKLTVFKQVIKANCVNVEQVIGFIDQFTYEEEKLEVAKLAYPKTVDQGNYYQIYDALTFTESVDELAAFLAKQ